MKLYDPTRFEEVYLLLEEVDQAEGNAEWETAKARCFIQDGVAKKVLDNFQTPFEDNVLLTERIQFFNIIVVDAKGRIQIFICEISKLEAGT